MAESFPRDTRILRFNPRAPQGYQGRRRDLLWPVLAYRVGVPVAPQSQKMDLFQRAVFGLLLHGINDVHQLADILKLHPDLVRIVKDFLCERGLIDQDDIIKPDAERRYRESRFDLAEQPDGFTTGYVFQEPFSGLLLPRLVETLVTADFTLLESGFLELRRGEKVFRPFVEFAPAERPPPPNAADVMRAFEASRKAQRGRWEADEEDGGTGTGPRFLRRVQRVNFIESQPELMYLSTFIFGSGLSSWEVADPFGLATSPLTPLAHKRLAKSGRLQAFVQRLDETATSDSDPRTDPVEEALSGLRLQLGAPVDSHPLLQPLLDAELAAGEFRAAHESQRQRRARQALGAARSLTEHLLREVRVRHPTAGAERQLLDGDRRYNLRQIEGAAEALSFETPLPAPLTSVKRNDVYWMANREDSGKLRPLLVSLLLSAVDAPAHPLHATAVHDPRFLREFDEVLGWCGEAAHVGTAPTDLEGRVEPALQRIYQAVRLLLGSERVVEPSVGTTFRVAPEPQELEFDDLDL